MRTGVAVLVALAWVSPARAGFAAAPTQPSGGARATFAMRALVPAVLVRSALATTAAFVDVQIPKNDGWVTDLAGLLSAAEERELEALMESYRTGTTHEIALLTVPDLGGQPIERFALEVGRAWKIGGKDKNNGALLVVSKNDRAIRIEVGRGLEGNLTDSISGRIIRDVIAPEFKRGRFAEGLKEGIQAIHAAIGGDYASLPAEKRVQPGGEIGALIFLVLFLVFLAIVIAKTRGRGPGGRRRGFGGFPVFIPTGGGRTWGGGGGGFSSGGFSGFGGGGGFSGGGASGKW